MTSCGRTRRAYAATLAVSNKKSPGLLAACTDLVPCTFDFNETTLSAHSYDFVVTGLSSGNYGIVVSWAPTTNFTAPNKAMACVGPVVVTTEQVKMFNQSTGISF